MDLRVFNCFLGVYFMAFVFDIQIPLGVKIYIVFVSVYNRSQ